MPDTQPQIEKLKRAITVLEEQQRDLGLDHSVQIANLQSQLNTLISVGISMQDSAVGGDVTIGDKITAGGNVIIAKDGAQIIQQVAAADTHALTLPEALHRYFDNLINTHRLLRLQGIRAGNQPLSVELEKVYISLTAIEKHAVAFPDRDDTIIGRSSKLTVADALARHKRLVIVGDPGSGKTTLLAYLALTYARTLRDGAPLIQERLALDETKHLPIFLPLRDVGRHLQTEHPDPGKDGPALLLNYLHQYYVAQDIPLPKRFFSDSLDANTCVLLLDGMDEVADPALRQRTARLIEKFATRYPDNRFIVTSRKVGYEGSSRIGAEFGLAEVREFTSAEVRQFVRDWTRAVEATLAGGETVDNKRIAEVEAEKLIASIEATARIAELAVNPLLLTVIALVHRYRAKLPERRSELYEEAVEVLLAGWDEAKGLTAQTTLAGLKLDSGDRRSLLEPVAFWLHEERRREIELADLRKLLLPSFVSLSGGGKRAAVKAIDDFLRLINERSGLLIERGMGVYAFAHLTFQEYLAARALADRADALEYTLKQLNDGWWREVLLLEAGYLSTQGKRRVSELIRAMMNSDPKTEPEPHHYLLLAAECLFDVGGARVEGDLLDEVMQRLKREADAPLTKRDRAQLLRKVAAMNALSRIETGQLMSRFWKPPWGEPGWVTVPAGEFWMGSKKGEYDDECPLHKVNVARFQIARVPITNAQYALFVADAKVEPPEYWLGSHPPKGKENHPVVNVSWHDAQAYCRWLNEKIGKVVRLPTEAEWEKAARGDGDQREYPWGDRWEELRCNSGELELGDTSPVGLFLSSSSSYGCLDMVGDVWEWCQSKYASYPYQSDDGREVIDSSDTSRVVRGASFIYSRRPARCASRRFNHPDYRSWDFGFRVIVPREY